MCAKKKFEIPPGVDTIVSDKKKFNALCKLLLSKDKDQFESGVNLYRSLNDRYLADKLLDEVNYKKNKLSFSEFYVDKGTYSVLYTVFLAILYYAPSDSKKAAELTKKTKKLYIDISDLKYLSVFPNVISLELSNSKKNLTSLNGIEVCKKLEELDCSSCFQITDFSAILHLPLKRLTITNCGNIESFEPLVALKEKSGNCLDLTCSCSNPDKIKFWCDNLKIAHTYLSKLKIESADLDNLDWLENFPSVEKLTLKLNSKNSTALKCIEGLRFTKNLRTLKLYGDGEKTFKNLDIFRHLPRLYAIGLSYCSEIINLDEFYSLAETDIYFGSDNDDEAYEYDDEYVEYHDDYDEYGNNNIDNDNDNDNDNDEDANYYDDELDYYIAQEYFEEKLLLNIDNCKNLEDIGGLNFQRKRLGIKDELVLNNLPKLKRLGDISNLKSICFNNSFNPCLIDELRKNRLSTVSITQNEIELNAEGVPINFILKINTEKLSLSGNAFTEIEIKGIKNNNLTNLRELDNLLTMSVEDAEIFSLKGISECRKLKSLFLINLPHLNDIEDLRYCPDLKHLIIKNCPELKSKTVLEELRGIEKLIIQ